MTLISNEKKIAIIAIILIAILSIVTISVIAYFETQRNIAQNNYSYLTDKYESLNNDYESLRNDYDSLKTDNSRITFDYSKLLNKYNILMNEYNITYAPSTLIENGIVHWRFRMLDGTVSEWTVDIDTYRSYINWPEPIEQLSLYNSNTGETYIVSDLREYVQPDFFTDVISDFTDGKTDREFVQNVVNFKNQIVTYGSGLGDFYRWPAETITEGRGQCGDTSILMASLFKAGEIRSNYGLHVYIWYCDGDHMRNPQDVNHAIVEVEYADGNFELIETTSDTFYTYNQMEGWKYEV